MAKHFEVEPLDVDKLVKVNGLKEVTNPIFFNKFGQPTSDGLLSNEIFGITKNDRATTFAYIDMGEPFISPPFYKAWCRLDSKVPACVHQTDTFRINADGKLEKDPNGNNGIKWMKDNFDKFRWKENESFQHNQDLKFMKKFKDVVFITKFPIIPAYYRDVNTNDGNRVDVGIINKAYNSLQLAVKSLKESKDYGLTLSGTIRGRVQECITEIYNWFAEEPQLGRKFGILRRANMAKTTDYSARLVMTAPNLVVENMEDLTADSTHASIPLAALCVTFFPFVLFHMKRWFSNEFAGRPMVEVINGKSYEMENYEVLFSEEELKKQIDRFIHGYSNRFIPINVPIKDPKERSKHFLKFAGRCISQKDYEALNTGNKTMADIMASSSIIDRRITWCDVIYQSVLKAVENKMVLITRYPIDSYFNQYPIKVNVSSTMQTETVILSGNLYKHYPKIREEYMGIDTSNMFVDTMNMSNVYLKSIGGDYDGDTCSVKGIYSDEANAEMEQHLKSLKHWIGLDGQLAIFAHAQAIDAVYAMTIGAPDMKKITDPEF